MRVTTIALQVLGLAASLQPGFAKTALRKTHRRTAANAKTDCLAVIQDKQFEDGHGEEKFVCEHSDGSSSDIVGEGAEQLKELVKKNKFKSGTQSIQDCQFKGNKNGHFHECYLPKGFSMKKAKSAKDTARQRKLATVTGDKTVLVVRVIAANGVTTADQARLSDAVFGTNGDSVTMASQYKACSFNKLNIIPTPDRTGTTGNSITNGATTVQVSTNTTEGDSVMNDAIADALNADFGVTSPSQLAHHVMYCLPPNTMSGIAYANVNSWKSVYSDDWCTYLSVQLHELGHNLALGHSGEGTGAYEDQSGMMGYSYADDNGPLMCFNGAKSWQLGWYADKSILVPGTPNFSGTYQLSGIADYDTAGKVVMKIDVDMSPDDYYVQFNRKTGINSGTIEGGDQVLITKAGGEGNSYAASELLAKLNAGQSFYLADISGTIEVDSIDLNANPAIATVTVSTNSLAPTITPASCADPGTPSSTARRFQFEITTDNYPSETSWTFTDTNNNNVLASSPSYSDANIVYTEEVICQEVDQSQIERYEFKIMDSYGDGLCCTHGQGGYKVFVDGKLVAAGGDIGSEETYRYPEVGAPTTPTTPTPVTPNPTPPPVTPNPTPPPVTPNPTPPPVTSNPTPPPVTSNPTPNPTIAPVTPNPTPPPVTSNPTPNPTTANPTANPTLAPVTPNPTPAPVTPNPTPIPTTLDCSSISTKDSCNANAGVCFWGVADCTKETHKGNGQCCSEGAPPPPTSPPPPPPPTSTPPPPTPTPSCASRNAGCSSNNDCCSGNCKNNGRCA